MDRKTINAEFRRQFFPLLNAGGFVRSGDVARRVLPGGVTHVVEIQHRPRADVFQVGLGVHLSPLDEVAATSSTPADQLREHDCAWRSSIISGFRNGSDAEFAYGQSAAEAAESVAFFVSEWPRQSEELFGPLTAFPEDFRTGAEAAASDESMHPAHLLTWARVAVLLEDGQLARSISAQALPRVPERATSLRDDLEGLSQG
ncbi:hypothetical protein FB468_0206 [Leucobacter komagatae]|uniref:DUF4304 domain-containing protein n=1 Tax=Leucobacter komagatae TaxID=55969 RepID=A0A542Y2G7_9MICO|nr:hypothetical protein [Leucobacter komagatae]TQL42223.1 hypothetical protein FB468_0206 [Leucobacter komagatae]